MEGERRSIQISMWLIVALLGAILFFISPARGGDVFLDDWEDGDMDLPDDLDGSSGYKEGWYTNDALTWTYDSGWGLNTQGYTYGARGTAYEGRYCAKSQFSYGYAADNNTLYFYIDLSSTGYAATNAYISFYYYLSSPYPWMASHSLFMYVFDDDDDSYHTVWTASITGSWKKANVEITDYMTTTPGQDTKIYIVHKTTTSGYHSYYYHYAKIDYLNFDIKESVDFAVDNLTATPESAEVNTSALIKAAVRNDGTSDYPSDITVKCTVKYANGSTVSGWPKTHTISGGLDEDEWTWVYWNFSDVSPNGMEEYTVIVEIDMANDLDDVDDSKETTIVRYWIKWMEGFETGDKDAPDPAMPDAWWIPEPLGDNGGGYYDAGAGLNTDPQYSWPSGSRDPYEGTYCAIERVSRYESNNVWMDVFFNMSGWDHVAISFWYDTYVYSWYQNYYRAVVQVSDDGGSTWTTLDGGWTDGSLPMDYTLNNWQQVTFDLSGNPDINMTNNVTIRFRFYTTYYYYAYASYYFKFDSIVMTGDPFDDDVTVREFDLPDIVRYGDEMDITALIKNVGKNDQTNVPVRLVIWDQWGVERCNETKYISRLDSLWEKTVTWTFKPNWISSYRAEVRTLLSTDDWPKNDMLSDTFRALPLAFWENFEDGDTNATNNSIPADEGWWIPEPFGDNYGWFDAGAGLNTEYTYSAYFRTPYEGRYCGMEALSWYDATTVWMNVSFIDTDYKSPLKLYFYWDSYGPGYYQNYVRVSYDGGDTWTTLNDGYPLGMDYTNGNWQYFEEDLPSFTSTPENITISFEFTTTYYYAYPFCWFKFDVIGLKFPLENDVGIESLIVPTLVGAGEELEISAVVKNYGWADQSGFDVRLYIYYENGTLYDYYDETVTETLGPGESTSLEFTGIVISFPSGMMDFIVNASTLLETDNDNTNNMSANYEMTVAWMAFFDTFESGDLVAPGAMSGWDPDPAYTGSGYGTFGGLNTYRGYDYPSGSKSAYAGDYCALEQFGWYYSAGVVTMDVSIWVRGWSDLYLYFNYDTYAYIWYSYRFHFEVFAYNGTEWIRLNGDSELPKDSTVNNWALYEENLSATGYFDFNNVSNITLRFQLRKDYGYSYYGYNYFKFDNVMLVGTPPERDAKISMLELSRHRLTVGDEIDIRVKVKNAGGKAQNTIQVKVEIVDQWGVKRKTYQQGAGYLAPGQTATMSWTYEPPTAATYTVTAYAILSGDTNPWNDNITDTFIAGLFVFYDGFEDGNDDATDNDIPADEGWEISRKMPANGLGAGAGVTSSDRHYYGSHGQAYDGRYCMIMQIDYYTKTVTVNFTMDMSDYKGAKLKFWYDTYMWTYYATYARVYVEANNGTGWTILNDGDSLVIDYTLNNWVYFEESLNESFMTDQLTIQFRFTTTYWSSYYYYFKFDEVYVLFLPENDMAVKEISLPEWVEPGRELVINATVSNEGWGTQHNVTVVCEVYYKNNDTLAWEDSAVVDGEIKMFDIRYVEFTFISWLWDPTEYYVQVYTTLDTDYDNSNNMSTGEFYTTWVLFWEDFEGIEKLVATGRWVIKGWEISDPLENSYSKSGIGRSDDGYYTRVRYGAYCGHAQLGGSRYSEPTNVYMDVYLRANNWTNVTLIFDYSWYRSPYYYFYAVVEVYDGSSWHTVYNVPQRSYDRNWYNSGEITIPDSYMVNGMILRFRYYNTYTYYMSAWYNFEFDNIMMRGSAPRPVANDIGVDAINAPQPGELINYNDGYYIINASVGNYGNNTVTLRAEVTCTNLKYNEVEYPTPVGTNEHTIAPRRIPPNLVYQEWNWTPQLHGWYLINVTVELVSGTAQNTWNDYYTVMVKVASVFMNYDFEDEAVFTTYGTNNEWEWGTPEVGPSEAHSGNNVWGTDLDANYDNYHYSYNGYIYIESPEVGPITGYYAVMQYYHWYVIEGYWDGLNVQISTDGGSTWSIIHPEGGYPYSFVYSSGQPAFAGTHRAWSLVEFNLTEYIGEKVKFRWQFSSDASITYEGYYLDDVLMYSFSARWDLMPIDLMPSADVPAFDDVAQIGDEHTTSTIQNIGLDDFDFDFNVTLTVGKMDYVNVFDNGDIETPISWVYSWRIWYPTYYEGNWVRYGWGYTGDVWEDGTPANVGPSSAHSGSRCIGYDIDGNAGGGYGYYQFATPAIYIDRSKGPVSTVSFWEYQEAGSYHYRYLYISKDGGYYRGVRYETSSRYDTKWVKYTIDISDVQEKFRLRFYYYTSSASAATAGWYIDDFTVLQLQPSADIVYNNTKVVVGGIGHGESMTLHWNWTPTGDCGLYYYNVTVETPHDEIPENDKISKQVFIGQWFAQYDFETGDHLEGFDTDDLSGYGDLWHVVDTSSPYFESWSSDHSDYAWWCGYDVNTTEKTYPHRDIGSMEGSYDLGMDNVLITPVIDLHTANHTYLTFWHRYIFQADNEGYAGQGNDDGAIVEITTNGGLSWEQIRPMDGYDGQIRINAISRGAGYYAFIRQKGWERETFDLSDYVGDRVQIRFRFMSYFYSDLYSNLTGKHGWFIDDMLIYGCEFEENTGLGHVYYTQNLYNDGTFVEDHAMLIHISGGNLGTSAAPSLDITLTIEDEDGNLVFERDMTATGYKSFWYNWTPDEPGTYTMTVETTAVADDDNPQDNNFTATFWIAAEALYEDVEHGPGQWSHGGAHDLWHIETIMYNSPGHSWYIGYYDEINGSFHYLPDTEAGLESPMIDLRSFRTATLTWASWWSLERDHDGFNLEFSEDGETWTARFGGIGQSSHGVFWQNPTIGHPQYSVANVMSLSNYVGKRMFMRIILRSDKNMITDGDNNPDTPSGVFMDDIHIYGDQYEDNVGIDTIVPTEGSHLVPGEPIDVEVNVTNLGRNPQVAVRVNLTIINETGAEVKKETKYVDINTLETSTAVFSWTPPSIPEGEVENFVIRAEAFIRNATGDYTSEDENPVDNLMEVNVDVRYYHDIGVDAIDVPIIVNASNPVDVSAQITNYGNVEESDFNVSFAVGEAYIEYPEIGAGAPHILIYNGYSSYDTHLYVTAVNEALDAMGAEAVVSVKQRVYDGRLTNSDIENNDIIIYVQRYGPLGYWWGGNNPDANRLVTFLRNGGNLFILGKYVVYYGDGFWYHYYSELCRYYLKVRQYGYIYSSPFYVVQFTGTETLLSEGREWAARTYMTYGHLLQSGGTEVFSFDRYAATTYDTAGVRFNGTYSGSQPFKTVYMVSDYYEAYRRDGSNSYNRVDEYEIDFMTNVLNWFFGPRSLNRTLILDIENITITDPVQPGETIVVNWTWDENLPEFDTYDISVVVDLPNDAVYTNDIMVVNTTGWTIKFSDDVESTGVNWTHYGVKDQWHRASIVWHAGEEDERKLYYSPTHAWWCGNDNTTKYTDNTNAYLESPWINLTTMAEAYVGFWIRYATEEGNDFIRVYVNYEDLLVPQTVSPAITGYNTEWEWMSFNLTQYVGREVKLLFLMYSDGNGITENAQMWLDTKEDWSGAFIDDIIVYGIEYGDNVAPEIIAPEWGDIVLMNDTVEIRSRLWNRGTNVQYGVPVYLKVYNQSDPTDVVVDTTLLGNVDVLSGHVVDLPTYYWTVPPEEGVTYVIEVWSELTGDENPLDDHNFTVVTARPYYDVSAVSVIVDDVVPYGVIPSINITYKNEGNSPDRLYANISILKLRDTILLSQDLESSTSGWTENPDARWEVTTELAHGGLNSMHGNSPWVAFIGTPGVTYWVSPVIDLSFSPKPLLTFHHLYNIDPSDGAMVQVSPVGDDEWYTINPAGGYPYRTGIGTGLGGEMFPAFNRLQQIWTEERFDLSAYYGTQIQIRFLIAYDGSTAEYIPEIFQTQPTPEYNIVPAGWYIDDIEIIGKEVAKEVYNTSIESTTLSAGDEEATSVPHNWTAEYGDYFVRLEVDSFHMDENPLNDAQQEPMSVANILFHDDLDTYRETGWQVYSVPGVEGDWHSKVPSPKYSDESPKAWWCGYDLTGTYIMGMNDTLTTRIIDLTHTEWVNMRLWQRYKFEIPKPGYDPDDFGHIEVAKVDEYGIPVTEWYTIRTFSLVNDDWHKIVVNVSAEVRPDVLNGPVRFRFRMEAGPNRVEPRWTGWFLDDIIIYGQPYGTNVGIESAVVPPVLDTETEYGGLDLNYSALSVTVVNFGSHKINASMVTVYLSIVPFDPAFTDAYHNASYVIPEELDVLESYTVNFTWMTPKLPSDVADNHLYVNFTLELTGDEQPLDDTESRTPYLGHMMWMWSFDDVTLDDLEAEGWIIGEHWTLTDYRSAPHTGQSMYCGDPTQDPPRYGPGYYTHLVSPMIYLPGVQPMLRFWHKFDFASGDYAELRIFATDDPNARPRSEREWDYLTLANGSVSVFRFSNDPYEDIDLSDYSWQYVMLRFSVITNDDQFFGEGWYLDDIVILGLEPYAAGIVAKDIRPDYIYPKPQYTNSSLTYDQILIGNLGSNSDTIYLNISLRGYVRVGHDYHWFDAEHWTLSVYDDTLGAYILHKEQLQNVTDTNDRGERIFSVGLNMAPGEVHYLVLTIWAPDKDHYHYIDSWKGTYFLNLTAESDGATDPQWKTKVQHLTPEILSPDPSLDKDRIYLDHERGQVFVGGRATFWILVRNVGTYMHNLLLDVWITGASESARIEGPNELGNKVTYDLRRGRHVTFFVGEPSIADTVIYPGNVSEVHSVMPPEISSETTYAHPDGHSYVFVEITLLYIPDSTSKDGKITIHFQLKDVENAQSPVAYNQSLKDRDTENNYAKKELYVRKRATTVTSFDPSLLSLTAFSAAIGVAIAVYRRRR